MFGLTRKLKKYKSSVSPSREFRRELWKDLSAAYDSEYGPEKRTVLLSRFAAVGIASLVLALGMGTGVYAYESPDVVEGHTLYPVKQGLERMEEWLANSPEARIRFHTKMMQRRLNEVEHVEAREEASQRLLESAAKELDMSLEDFVEELKEPASREDILEELSETNARYADILSRVTIKQRPPLPPGLHTQLHEIRLDVEASGLPQAEKRQLFRAEWQAILNNGDLGPNDNSSNQSP